jgi:class 3 adenylate cyclase/tetratricopeptide (TPR) repeat protein
VATGQRQERKTVTVLFADLVGFTSRAEQLDPEDVAALLGPYHAQLRSELERRGGTVEKFIGDAVMAVFGAPAAHEDDPERAVRAALAIRDAIREDGQLEVRIAVSTGEALVTLGVRPELGEGMVAGDVVNTAARLQSAAPVNGILVGEQTYRATREAIEYAEADPVEAKGKAEPIGVWEAVEARARFGVDVQQRTRAPLVGRARELDLLTGAFARSRQELSPQLVTVVGVPGIGKTRLVLELLRAVEDEPELITWRQGRCLPYGEGVAFWALAEIAKAQAGILESDGPAEAETKLREAVIAAVSDEAAVQWVEGHMRPLVGLGGGESGADRRAEAFSAWRRFLEGLAEDRPAVLVFEDLHWADEGLLDFLDELVDWASGVAMLVVCTTRPELLERRPGWGGGKRNATTISLSALSGEETARLVGALLDETVLPAEVQSALLEHAEGNPLYAEEYTRAYAERGSVVDLALPETVQGLILGRLDMLPAAEKSLVQDAAVVGKVFWAGAAAAIGGRGRGDVETLLHALERKEFVRRERRASVAGETQYAFLHLLVRDVAYGQIPRRERAEKHRLAAEWIASTAAGRAEDAAEMLAHHYLQALELSEVAGLDTASIAEPARRAFREAGARAFALHAQDAADRYYQAALKLYAPDDDGRAYVLLDLLRTAWDLDLDRSALAAEASQAFLRLGDPESAAMAEMLAARLDWARGERERGYVHGERALGLIEARPPSEAKAYVLVAWANLRMLAGENAEAVRLGRLGLEIATELGLDEARASLLNSIGTARANSGDEGGMAEMEQALELAERVGSPREIHRAYNNLANTNWWFGRVREAEPYVQRMRANSERFALPSLERWTQGELVLYSHLMGRWRETERLAGEFIDVVEGTHYLETPCRSYRALVRLARGDLDGALEDVERATELGRAAADHQVLTVALSARAFVLARLGRREDASAAVDELLALSDTPLEKIHDVWLIVFAWAALDCGRGDVPVSEAALPTPWREAAGAIVSGHFDTAADVLDRIGAEGEAAYARLRAAERLASEGRRTAADVKLRPALAFFREEGATAYLRRGEALLAASA